MAGRLFGTFLIIIFLTYMVLLSTFYFMHQSVFMNVNTLNYNVCESLSTSGVFTPQLYEYLTDTLSKYGDYLIKIKLEKQLKSGVYDTYFYNDSDIKKEIKPSGPPDPGYYYLINRKLGIGDRVTVYVEDRDVTLFGRLINASFMGNSSRIVNTRIKSLKSCIIANEARDFVKGYDVIAEINNNRQRSILDGEISITVQTKMGTSKYSNEMTAGIMNNLYGDSSNEQINSATGTPGPHYISVDSEFLQKYVYKNDGNVGEIIYIQQ